MKILKISDSKNRNYTDFGHLKVDNCVITCEGIQEYCGDELPDASYIDKKKMYKIYRPLAEIKKNLDSYDNVPLTDEHYFVDGEAVHKDKWLGGVGTNARIKDGKLYNSIAVWDTDGVDLLEKHKQDLSAGYSFNLVNKSGTFNGEHYDFVMENIKCNHVALVKNGRVPEAKVADHNKYLERTAMSKITDALGKLRGAMGLDTKGKDNDEDDELEDEESGKESTGSSKASTKDAEINEVEDDDDDDKVEDNDDDELEDADDDELEDADDDEMEDAKPGKAGDSQVSIRLISSSNQGKGARVMDTERIDQRIEDTVKEVIGSRIKAKALCEDALGGISAFNEATSISTMYNETLKALGHDSKEIRAYSTDTKEALLRHQVSSTHKQKQAAFKQPYIADSTSEIYEHLV